MMSKFEIEAKPIADDYNGDLPYYAVRNSINITPIGALIRALLHGDLQHLVIAGQPTNEQLTRALLMCNVGYLVELKEPRSGVLIALAERITAKTAMIAELYYDIRAIRIACTEVGRVALIDSLCKKLSIAITDDDDYNIDMAEIECDKVLQQYNQCQATYLAHLESIRQEPTGIYDFDAMLKLINRYANTWFNPAIETVSRFIQLYTEAKAEDEHRQAKILQLDGHEREPEQIRA